jgi:hypothetical protein
MPRRRPARTSDDVACEIARLQGQRAELDAAEHARRGELVRHYLGGPRGEELRRVLDPLVAPADRHLFGLAPGGRTARVAGTAAPIPDDVAVATP